MRGSSVLAATLAMGFAVSDDLFPVAPAPRAHRPLPGTPGKHQRKKKRKQQRAARRVNR